MKDFAKKVYEKLNTVIINWVDSRITYGEIKEYSSKRYRAVEGFNTPINDYNVRIELKNGYNIGISIVASGSRDKYNITRSLLVYATGPCIVEINDGSGHIDSRPRHIEKERIVFVDGEFDIDNIDWTLDVLNFLNKYAQQAKAEVEVVD